MLFSEIFKEEKIELNKIKINFKHGGVGKPLLLIHGYPQTHVMWHKVANELAKNYYVICPDLRGYGDSSKPKGLENHENYSKKTMAKDMFELLSYLGFNKFYVAGHDRGARVTHRICLDYPKNVLKACIMDIAPTYHMFKNTNQEFATGYYHWFFLIQTNNLPETMIGYNPAYYLEEKLKRWSNRELAYEKKFDKEAISEYIRCFDEESIHATCEDYRAAATVDMEDDKKDRNKKVYTPLLVLWGEKGFINKTYNVLKVWEDYAINVSGKTLNCGHFLPEEKPVEVINEINNFFK